MTRYVVHIIGDGRLGGGTSAVMGLIRHAPTPWSCSLITQRGSHALAEADHLGLRRAGLPFFPYRLNPATVAGLRRILSEWKPDIVHIHAARAGLPLTLAFPGERPFRTVYTVHGHHYLGKTGLFRALGRLAEKRCHARADASVFVSRAERDLAVTEGLLPPDRRPEVIYNGIDQTELKALQEDRSPSSTGPQTIGYLGRLSFEKRPQILLDVLNRLRERNLHGLVVGGGPMEAELRAEAARRGLAERITFLGALPRLDALNAIRGCDLVLLPSLWEAQSLTLVECAALRIPVVASRVGGIPEVVEDGVTGYLIDPADIDGFASAVDRLLDDGAGRTAMGTRAADRVSRLFTVTTQATSFAALYDRLMAEETERPQWD